jgi:apolipoprotein N-acyltransferase
VWGVSFWLLWFNVLAVFLFQNRSVKKAVVLFGALMMILVALPLLYSSLVFSKAGISTEAPTVRVTIVQPDIDPHDKWNTYDPAETLDLFYRLTARAVSLERPDLVIWPETALPFLILDPRFEAYMHSLRRTLSGLNVSLLTGFIDVVSAPPRLAGNATDNMQVTMNPGRDFNSYNASMMVRPDGTAPQIYHKMRLVPFGERVPFMEYFPWLERFSFSLAGVRSWSKGKDITIMEFRNSRGGTVRTADIICYESIFPGLVAEFVKRGAQFLTLVTNDGWYSTSYGPYQHAAIGRLRCIENRRSMARCANTGVTLFYDRYGRSYEEIPWWERRTVTAEVSLNNELSWYTRHIDLLPKVALGISGSLVLFAMVWRKREG